MAASVHPAATNHLPGFITPPGETDVLMIAMAIILALAVLGFGILFLRLHTLPERIAHRTHKLQFEIVAVLGLIALFTHMHIFWIVGLLLALIDIPDFLGPLRRMAGSLEKLAGYAPGRADIPLDEVTITGTASDTPPAAAAPPLHEERTTASPELARSSAGA